MKIITGVIILSMFIGPFVSPFDPVVDWQAEIERMGQQMQKNVQQEITYVTNSVESALLHQIEDEIKTRFNDMIWDQKCSVSDVEIELGQEEGGFELKGSEGGGSWTFRRVKVTLQGMDTADLTEAGEERTIQIDEIIVGIESESDAEHQETQELGQNAKIEEYRQLFARTLGISADRVEVTYRGEW